MSTKHERPPHETKLKTTGHAALEVPAAARVLFGDEARAPGAACTIITDVTDGEPAAAMWIAVAGERVSLNVVSAVALLRALVEHLSARGDLAARRDADAELDDDMLAAIAGEIVAGRIPEHVEAAEQ